ncbi:tRNA (adenosine(37)-N6)-threonylcarbamoyltransferase complex ATPase subunit type 1 TsaE [Candidatus Persebacteraceae bacterium Df01]|jgi:tRNA threonylcarbamoyladenosine biosynthesis protein TsaE|uniref:tRNA threonylcarbamoyladenosine biosynthesis protein TsaE n=1 Tax=Candidatus Doriopsillibacter californiensis TaxID=2970740 RepID=A0ABT7QMV0_9GAMM|nr:tRNA (adenosine(37)-N6)-threonylcarbamoyltransferase complex ATPase subunit type 1 TsaE [Candidatus Persebacteraceae bacterium Df01]
MIEYITASPAQTAATAKKLAPLLPPPPFAIHLHGELGTGKTLWARALIQELGGIRAPSPSFALVFSYQLSALPVHHLDLFRLPQGTILPDDLWEILHDDALCLVEWPERAEDLPPPDVRLTLQTNKDETRRLFFCGDSEKGETCLRAFSS